MTWERFDRGSTYAAHHKRRERPCVSRSPDRPDIAYLMIPRDRVTSSRVSIYTKKDGKIAFEFCDDGDYKVRGTSATSYAMRITIPKALSGMIPFGLNDVDLQTTEDGWLVLDAHALT